jgi:hypothetical protein
LQNGTFVLLLSVINEVPVSYRWTLPEGLSIVSGDNTIRITVRCDKTGNYNGSDIKVTVTNDCGQRQGRKGYALTLIRSIYE